MLDRNYHKLPNNFRVQKGVRHRDYYTDQTVDDANGQSADIYINGLSGARIAPATFGFIYLVQNQQREANGHKPI